MRISTTSPASPPNPGSRHQAPVQHQTARPQRPQVDFSEEAEAETRQQVRRAENQLHLDALTETFTGEAADWLNDDALERQRENLREHATSCVPGADRALERFDRALTRYHVSRATLDSIEALQVLHDPNSDASQRASASNDLAKARLDLLEAQQEAAENQRDRARLRPECRTVPRPTLPRVVRTPPTRPTPVVVPGPGGIRVVASN
ncbi:MAG: hypothetical protein U0931_30520 [Vulcanimicrobiota bacterium]